VRLKELMTKSKSHSQKGLDTKKCTPNNYKLVLSVKRRNSANLDKKRQKKPEKKQQNTVENTPCLRGKNGGISTWKTYIKKPS
jgi:hypothetical protein